MRRNTHRAAQNPPPSVKFYQMFTKRPEDLARAAHRALGPRTSRADFWYGDRVEGTGGLICLEVKTQPGMTSRVPMLAAYAGKSFGELVRWIVEDASLDR